MVSATEAGDGHEEGMSCREGGDGTSVPMIDEEEEDDEAAAAAASAAAVPPPSRPPTWTGKVTITPSCCSSNAAPMMYTGNKTRRNGLGAFGDALNYEMLMYRFKS